MKTMNTNHVMPTIENLKKHPIHNYGKLETDTGRVISGNIKSYRRKNGSCQIVFEMMLAGNHIKEMELYVKDEQEWFAAKQMLLSGQPLTVDYCLRYDQYLHPHGVQTERKFWFIDGVDAIHPVAAA